MKNQTGELLTLQKQLGIIAFLNNKQDDSEYCTSYIPQRV
jgi:hypothetical protein